MWFLFAILSMGELDVINCLASNKHVFGWQVLDPAASVFSAGHFTTKRIRLYELRGTFVTNRSLDGNCWNIFLPSFSAGKFPHQKGSALTTAWPIRHKQVTGRQVLDLVASVFSAGKFPTTRCRLCRLRGPSSHEQLFLIF